MKSSNPKFGEQWTSYQEQSGHYASEELFYVTRILSPCDDYALKLVIYDQLNPSIANYWSEKEFTDILTSAGFKNIKTDHRHGYSWTALAN